jgi:hypothetical protein
VLVVNCMVFHSCVLWLMMTCRGSLCTDQAAGCNANAGAPLEPRPARSCMLGLRPRLKSRPSLLELIQNKNIDYISVSDQRVVPILTAAVEPTSVPLPRSPLIAPQQEIPGQPPPPPPPPRITLNGDSYKGDAIEQAAKMPPVSLAERTMQLAVSS